MRRAGLLGLLAGLALPAAVHAQPLDMSHGGPIEITARDGLEWHQADQQVVAIGDARAVRGTVTVIADRLVAHYRRRAGAPAASAAARPAAIPAAAQPQGELDTGDNEIYRLEAIGNVHIYSPTDQAWADHAVYDIDQSVLVMTGHALKITTPQDVITARDDLEYWSQKHMAVARGDAVVTTSDARRISADTLVAYTTEPPPGPKPAAAPSSAAPAAADPMTASGKLQRVEAFGHVVIRTPTQTVEGDRGVYVPDTGIARMAGGARLTQGDNQVNGAGLEVNLKTGIYRLVAAPGARVQGLVVPNDTGAAGPGAAP